MGLNFGQLKSTSRGRCGGVGETGSELWSTKIYWGWVGG